MKRAYILADIQDITREGIKSLLKQYDLSEEIIEPKNLLEFKKALSLYPTSVVVLDYTLFDFFSKEQMLMVKEKAKGSDWLLFSEDLAESFIRNLLHSDPSINIVLKHSSRDEIEAALQSAGKGKNYICKPIEEILSVYKTEIKEEEKLTSSEKSVLHEIAKGKTTKEIAAEKFLSFHTVNTHRRNIFRKLEVNNMQEAIKYAYRAGIVDASDYQI